MASIDLYSETASVKPIGSTVINTLRTVAARVDRWNTARKTRAELYSLSIRELDDIGIAYGDIKKIR